MNTRTERSNTRRLLTTAALCSVMLVAALGGCGATPPLSAPNGPGGSYVLRGQDIEKLADAENGLDPMVAILGLANPAPSHTPNCSCGEHDRPVGPVATR